MDAFWLMVPRLLPSWLISIMAMVAAVEMMALCVYLMRHGDHLILHAADLGLTGVFLMIVAVHYSLILIAPGDFARSRRCFNH